MQIDDLVKHTGPWLRGEGADAQVVISSRVRLARNLDGHRFLSRADESERKEIYRELLNCATEVDDQDKDHLVVELEETGDLDRQFLVERHLISRQHAEAKGCRGAVISADESRTLMINEEDHLRMQCLGSGLQLSSLWERLSKLDDAMDERTRFSFHDRFGYLTACPTNVGTGIRVSVMVHLPALKLTGDLEKVFRAARDMRLAIRGLFGEGTDAIGDFFQISNQSTLGKSEEEIIDELGDQIIPQIVEYEQAARKALAQERAYQLDDRIWRGYGVLANARTIGTDDALYLLSHLRLGIQMGRFKEASLTTVNELFLLTQRAHLQKVAGRSMDGEQRSIARAELLRERLGSPN